MPGAYWRAAARRPRAPRGRAAFVSRQVSGAGLGEASSLSGLGGLEPDLGHRLLEPLAVRLVVLHRVEVALDGVRLVGGRAVLVRGDRALGDLDGGGGLLDLDLDDLLVLGGLLGLLGVLCSALAA